MKSKQIPVGAVVGVVVVLLLIIGFFAYKQASPPAGDYSGMSNDELVQKAKIAREQESKNKANGIGGGFHPDAPPAAGSSTK